MNNISLQELEEERDNLLESYFLSEREINKKKKEIKKISLEESNRLGKKLIEYLKKLRPKNYSYDAFKRVDENVLLLINRGANINYKDDEYGDFPLILCIRKKCKKSILYLLQSGADINLSNNANITPIMEAAKEGLDNILELLILLGADVNSESIYGENALMMSKRNNQNKCFNILLNNQISIFHKNIQDETVLDITDNIDLKRLINNNDVIDEKKILKNAYMDMKEIIKKTNEKKLKR